MSIRSLLRLALRLSIPSLCLLAPEAALPAADFIRGDANGDGSVTISDAHFNFSHQFRDGDSSGCLKALDVDDNGSVDLTDGVYIMQHLYEGGSPPAAPYPGKGPDTTIDNLSCETYGGGSPLADPLAELLVLDAVANGGNEATAFIKLGVSSGTSLGGYSCRIGVEGDVFDNVAYGRELSGLPADIFSTRVVEGQIRVGFISNMIRVRRWIGPGERLEVLEIAVCLRPGLAAGEYPLTITAGELIDAYSGRAIHPRLGGGRLRVLSGIADRPDCVKEIPPPDRPEDMEVSFTLESPDIVRGSTVGVGFSILSNSPSQGFDFSIDFDEENLRLLKVEPVFRSGRTDWDSFDFTVDNTNMKPGNDGVDEGYVAGSAIFTAGGEPVLPANDRTEVLRLVFEVAAPRTSNCIAVAFADGGRLEAAGGAPVTNGIRVRGQAITAQNAESFKGKNGLIQVFSPEGEVAKKPEELEAEYRLASVRGAPGSEVTVPLSIRANAQVQGFAFSIDFDEEVLQVTGVDRLHYLAPAIPWDSWLFRMENSNAAPGNGGIDEGYVAGHAIFSLTRSGVCSGSIPANDDTDVLALRFLVNPHTTAHSTELNFLDGGRLFGLSQGVSNVVTVFGTSVDPQTASSFVFLNGLVNIVPDISVFVRGDSNGDDAVDLSDAQRTLGYLFLGDGPPACYDAADSNDDGTINIADPIYTLGYLFLSVVNIPKPYPEKGTDPTEDPLGCTVRRD